VKVNGKTFKQPMCLPLGRNQVRFTKSDLCSPRAQKLQQSGGWH